MLGDLARTASPPVTLTLRQMPRIEEGKLRPVIEYRERRVTPSANNLLGIEMVPYIIGHGQQLARKREMLKALEVEGMYHLTPDPRARSRRR